ncbi:MAG: type IV pilus assembly protein PilM [bacterium]
MKLPEFFGLDIGSQSIKIAQAHQKSARSAELIAIGSKDSIQDLNDFSTTAVKNELADKIKVIKDASGIVAKKVVAAMPESSIFTRLVMLPDVGEDELEQSVYYEASQYLPTPVSEVQLDYIPINKVNVEGRNLIRALLVAAPKKLAADFMEIMQLAGLELIALETETIATTRALTFKQDFQESVLVLDFGAMGTDISVIKGRSLIFSQSLGTGSDALSKAIANDFGLEAQQAEQYKRTYGLVSDQADGKIANSLAPVMQVIINEINKTINYFRAHLQESSPTKILLIGNGAKLPGLNTYLTQNLGIEAFFVDPVAQLEVSGHLKAELAQLSTVGFTVAVGLALKMT